MRRMYVCVYVCMSRTYRVFVEHGGKAEAALFTAVIQIGARSEGDHVSERQETSYNRTIHGRVS